MKPGGVGVFAVAVILVGCAGPDGSHPRSEGEPETGHVTLDLRATPYNAGRLGQAILLPQENSTRIVLRFNGVPAFVTVPVHVYTYIYAATCGDLPPTPAWSLNDRVLVGNVVGASASGARTMFTISHTVPVPLSELRGGRYAIALRTAPADGDRVIFCGEIGSA